MSFLLIQARGGVSYPWPRRLVPAILEPWQPVKHKSDNISPRTKLIVEFVWIIFLLSKLWLLLLNSTQFLRKMARKKCLWSRDGSRWCTSSIFTTTCPPHNVEADQKLPRAKAETFFSRELSVSEMSMRGKLLRALSPLFGEWIWRI